MKFPYLKTTLVLCVGLSSPVSWAEHPMNPPIDINQSFVGHIDNVKLRHQVDDSYVLKGEVRRQNNFPVSMGHIDLQVLQGGKVVYEDAQNYFPRVVNRRYKYPSSFEFVIPEAWVNGETMKLSFHRKESGAGESR